MAVSNPDVIDAIGIEHGTGIIVLTIANDLDWDGDESHLMILQNKINRYMGFIESGELLEHYPTAVDKPIRIDVVCRFQPSEEAIIFLDRARNVVEEAGWLFSWSVYQGE
jgi:hypothetical protein